MCSGIVSELPWEFSCGLILLDFPGLGLIGIANITLVLDRVDRLVLVSMYTHNVLIRSIWYSTTFVLRLFVVVFLGLVYTNYCSVHFLCIRSELKGYTWHIKCNKIITDSKIFVQDKNIDKKENQKMFVIWTWNNLVHT